MTLAMDGVKLPGLMALGSSASIQRPLAEALGMALGSMEPMILKVLGRMHLKDVSVFTTKTFRNCVPSSRWALSLKLKTKDCALLLARQIP